MTELGEGLRDTLSTHGAQGSGILGVLEFTQLSFVPARVFWIYGADKTVVRAKHWHKQDEQYLVCLVGTLEVSRVGRQGETIVNLSAGSGVALPTQTWIELRNFSEGSVALVLSSRPYDPNDCFSDYAEFERVVIGKP